MNNKLRAWDNNNGHMVYSSEDDAVFILHENKWKIKYTREKPFNNDGIEIDAPVWEESDDVEVMRFTGRHGKGEKAIYEGDIATYFNRTGQIIFDDKECGYCLFTKEDNVFVQLLNRIAVDIEVIGNIHQHPNLLK